MEIFFFLTFAFLLIRTQSSEFLCNEKFPLVTDFGPEDCNNAASLFYNPNKHGDCLPGCDEVGTQVTCKNGKCPAGYKCDTTCVIDEESCMKYYTKYKNKDNKYFDALWKPECLPDGSWKAKQCKGYNRCYCFDHKGKRIFGDAFYYEAEDMTCACSRKRAELEETLGQFFVSLHCDSMGNYEPLQCDTGHCWCVEPKTGDLTAPVVPEKLMKQLPCYNSTIVGQQYMRQCESHLHAQEKIRDEFFAHGQNANFGTLRCLYDGGYGPFKMAGDITYCVWKDNSQIGSYASQGSSVQKTMNCNCARDNKIYELAGKTHLSACLANGNYNPVQNFDDDYYCVDSDGYRKSKIITNPTIEINAEYCDNFA